jgi:hypothetical protein
LENRIEIAEEEKPVAGIGSVDYVLEQPTEAIAIDPSALETLTVFVIDISGSMRCRACNEFLSANRS